jgi:uncharacterized membrane protein YiaA
MSFRDYLHERAEESRHNETLAYLMFLAGAVFFVGGVLTALSLGAEPSWFLVIPYYTEANPGSILSLMLVFSGITLTVFGIFAGFFYSRHRGWYMHELHKASSIDEARVHKQSGKNNRKKKNNVG